MEMTQALVTLGRSIEQRVQRWWIVLQAAPAITELSRSETVRMPMGSRPPMRRRS